MANFLTTNTITWTFDKELTRQGLGDTYQYGTYCNGNYWVVGPVTIIDIDPAWNGSHNGAEINTIPSGYEQGLVTANGDSSYTYRSNLNVATSIPRTVQPESSLLSVAGTGQCPGGAHMEDGHKTMISYAAVLTIVTSPPPVGSFRPGYGGNTKIIMGAESGIRYDRLARVAPSAGMTSLSTMTNLFKDVRPNHISEFLVTPLQPCSQGAEGYGGNNSGSISEAVLIANCDFSAIQKRDLVIAIVQMGIDLYSLQSNKLPGAGLWTPNGGHGFNAKLPIMFAGAVLDNADLMGVGILSGAHLYDNGGSAGNAPSDYWFFAEDSQTYYVKQADVDRSNQFNSGDIGLPEMGIRHATDPSRDVWFYGTNSENDADYRFCCTSPAWAAGILAMHMMSLQGVNVKNLWNHPALFDYVDRWMDLEGGTFLHYNPTWVSSMWNNYRAAYPPVWPDEGAGDTTPPLPPTSLISTQQSDSTINLSWTAGGQAADGDFPIGYRVYRDGQLIISITGTTYVDTGLSANTSYDYDIYSYDDVGNDSSSAASGTFSTEVAAPAITTIFINGSGSDSNDGSDWANARRFLPAVLARGTTYYIGAGYFGNYTFNDAPNTTKIIIKKATLADHGTETGWNVAYEGRAEWGNISFSSTSHIDFIGGATNQTRIQHNGPSPASAVVTISGCSNVRFDYCEFDGMNGGLGNVCTSVFNIQNNSYIWIEHSTIHNANDDIIVSYSNDHMYLRWNRVHTAYSAAGAHSDGIELYNCDDCEIIGNLFYDCGSDACVFTANWDSATCDRLFFANNIFYNSGQSYYACYLNQTTDCKFYNNIVWGFFGGSSVQDAGLAIEQTNDGMDLRNNILAGITTGTGQPTSWNPSNTGDYNILWGNINGYQTGSNDIIGVDPEFTGVPLNGSIANPSIADFAPTDETAPTVDSGTAIPEVAYDIQHQGRPSGVANDIGPFEYAGAVVTTGACCNPATGECIITTAAQCSFNWLGAGSSCLDCQTPVPTVGLTVSYPCDDLTGYSAADASGNVNAGTLINVNNNFVDGATEFTETGEVLMTDKHDGIQTLTQNMQVSRGTVAMAIYPTEVTGLDPDRLYANRYLFGHTVGEWSNVIQLFITDGYLQIGMGDNHFSATDVFPMAADDWYHIIFTWLDNGITIDVDGMATGTPTGSGVWTLYVDGVVITTGAYSGLTQLNAWATFGNTGPITTPSDEEAFEGYMDNLKLYDAPLSATQAADLAYIDGRDVPPPVEPTIDPPVIENDAAVTITATTAIMGGEVTDTGGEIPSVTLYYGETDEGEVAASWDSNIDLGSVLGTFNVPIGNLTHNTTYFFRCYAVNSGGEDWADSSETFDTLEIVAPTIVQNAATNVAQTTATLSGTITDDGNELPTQVTVYYGETDESEVAGSWDEFVAAIPDENGNFSVSIIGLTADTLHYFRVYAANSVANDWGSATLSFTTDPTGAPVVVNIAASDIDAHEGRIAGEVTDVGLENPTVTVYWGRSDGGITPANWDNSASLGVQTGEFDALITGLALATIYYYRVFATNSFGDDWATSTQSFSTLLVEPIFPDPNTKPDGFIWGSYDNAYEIVTPYEDEDIFSVHRVSRGDVTYLAHDGHAPRKLTRFADKDWRIEEIDFVGGPFLRVNIEEDKTCQYVNGSGGMSGNYYDVGNTGTIDAVGHTPFLEAMVGSLWMLEHTRQDNTIDEADNHTHATPTGEGIRVHGDWQFDCSEMSGGTPNYTTKIWRRAVPGQWQEYKHFSAATLASGTEDEVDVFYTWTDSNATVEGAFTAQNQINVGIVKITSFISTSQVAVEVKKSVYQESDVSVAVSAWAEGAWNDYRGFPRSVTFYGNRLWWAGTTNNPQGMWGSRVGFYEDHTGGVADSDAVDITISDNDVSSIEWLTSTQSLIVGSARKEYIVSASDRNDAITPKDNIAKPHSTNGSLHIQPVEVDGGMMYAQRLGYKMLMLSYQYLDDAYNSTDTNRLAPHMFQYPAKDISKQGTPETVVWVTREDGTLCAYRYDKDEEISAWSRIVTGALVDSPTHPFISSAVIAGSTEDRVWTVVQREVNGITNYYVERFAYRNYVALSDSLFLDSAKTVTTDSVGTLSRLHYLEGHTVTVMLDTEKIGDYLITNGQIIGLTADTEYTVGLPYMSKLRTMAFAVPGVVTEGSIKRYISLLVRSVRTRGGQAGVETHGKENIVDLDIPYSLDAADTEKFAESGYDKEGRVTLLFNDPYPATILCMVFEMEII